MTPSHGQASVGQPARTYLYQLSTDIGCLEDLPEAMDDRNEWRETWHDDDDNDIECMCVVVLKG